MTLPFENDNKRKYTCFVCGVAFKYDEIEDYKKHIIETHDEGREYIICPLNHCQSPVRDIRAHFKVCHPQIEVPKNMQLRVMVWKDQGTKKRRKLTFKEGFYISMKNGGKSMHYRSSYEHKIYECLDKLNRIVSYHVEPFSVPYFFAGKTRKYFPDLRVDLADGSSEIWEIKPSTQTASDLNRAKWHACEQLCLTKGWKFAVKTEKGITNLLLEAEKQNLPE